MTRSLLVATLLVACSAPALAAPPDPFDLVQGLRENGMPDLALEYLDELAKNPTAEMKVVIPLEKAKTHLLLAQLETDESVRDAAIAQAKQQFDFFLLDHPKHPRAAEAALASARVLSLQAKARLNRAARIEVPYGEDGRPDPGKMKEKKAAYVAIRPLFKKATERFGEAAKQIKAVVDNPTTDPFRRRSLTREAMQAELDRGINQFSLSETYLAAEGNEALERAAALKDAKQIFTDLSRVDPNNPICWSARAWAGACDLEIQDVGKAKETFQAIRSEAARNPQAGADGVRMVEFFEAQGEYLSARAGELPAVRSARVKAKNWLDKDKYKPRMTPERLSMTFYHAYLTQREAENDAGNVYDKKTDPNARKLLTVSSSARALLQEAAREYKQLQEFDNDYTERATRQRMRAIRFIVGDAMKKAPAEYTNFDECLMAAQVRLGMLDEMIAGTDETADDKKPDPKKPAGPKKAEESPEVRKEKAQAGVVALFERAVDLITPAVPAKDATEAWLWLARAYFLCDRPHQAAVAAAYVAETSRGAVAAKAGVVAIESYLAARGKLEPNDAEGRAVDRERAIELGLAMDKAHAADPATDNVRFRLGQLFLEEKEYRRAFDALGKVNVSYSGVAAARTMQGRAAFMLAVGKDSPLTPEQRTATLRKAMTAAEAVPEPTNPDHFKAFFGMRNVLAQLYLIQVKPADLATAQKVAADTVKRAKAAQMPEGDKKATWYAAEEIRLRAVFAAAVPLFKDGKYKEMADLLTPVLLAMKDGGTAAKEVEAYRGKEAGETEGDTGSAVVAADSLDKFRRDLIVLALQGRIRERAFDQAAELFKLLEQLGGSVEATTDALARLVTQVRPQIDELKKQGKTDEAQQLMDVVGKLLTEQAAKDKLAARPRAFLGRALRDLGLHEKALEVLAGVPVVDDATLKLPTAQLDPDKRDAVIAFQVAKIEQIRAYRAAKQFDKADEILTAALGPDGKSGWARSLEFRKEKVFVIEDRAAEAPADKKRELWGKAVSGWTEVLRPYVGAVSAPIPKDADVARVRQDREKLYPIILDLFVEEKRCLAKANTQLLGGNMAKLADSLNTQGKVIARLEKGYAKGLTTEVRERYAELLDEFPAVKDGYKQAGGVAFLDPTAELPSPDAPAGQPNGEKK
jgi:tetratricopeptide (TPR) repeat protein